MIYEIKQTPSQLFTQLKLVAKRKPEKIQTFTK